MAKVRIYFMVFILPNPALLFGLPDTDKTKRSITFTGSTSQRISFQEVQLAPKGSSVSVPSSPLNGKSKSKGKSKVEGDDEPEGVVQEGDPHMVDRVTGKVTPQSRATKAKKTKKTGSDKEVEGEDMEGGRSRKRKPTAKVQGKQKVQRKGKTKAMVEEVVDEDNAGAGGDGMDVDEG